MSVQHQAQGSVTVLLTVLTLLDHTGVTVILVMCLVGMDTLVLVRNLYLEKAMNY